MFPWKRGPDETASGPAHLRMSSRGVPIASNERFVAITAGGQCRDMSGAFLVPDLVVCIIMTFNTHDRHPMRTNIVIDDKLMADALEATGAKTKKEAVELGLKALVRLKQQERIKGFRGKLQWKDDLDRMRTD